MPRSNPINQGTPQIIRPTNLIQLQNQTVPPPQGTDHDIGFNLTIHISLEDPTPAQPLHELLLEAQDQVRERAALFGPTSPVPRRQKKPELTQTTHAGLIYFIERARALNPSYPGLEWGELQVATSWLYGYLWTQPNHRECSFVLFREIDTTGESLNLAFGGIRPLETKSQSNVETT